MNRLIFSSMLAAAMLSTGCATITRGTTEVLVIETEPPGADVLVSPEGRNCKSPCSLELKRKRDYVVDIARPGYEPAPTAVPAPTRVVPDPATTRVSMAQP